MVIIMKENEAPPPVPLNSPEAVVSGGDISREEKNWAICAHLASVVGWVGVPFGHIIAPLVVWLIKKDESDFVRRQSLESLNFQISMTIYAFLAGLLAITIIGLVVAIPLIIILVAGDIILTIVGAVKVNEGVAYRYPATMRFF